MRWVLLCAALLSSVACGRSEFLDLPGASGGSSGLEPGAGNASNAGARGNPDAGGSRGAGDTRGGGGTSITGAGGALGRGGAGGMFAEGGAGGGVTGTPDAGLDRDGSIPVPPDAATWVDASFPDAGTTTRVGYAEDVGQSGTYDANYLIAYRLFVPSDSTLAGFGIVLRSSPQADGRLAFALYEDDIHAGGPRPGKLLTRSDLASVPAKQTRMELPARARVTLTGNEYCWIAFTLNRDRRLGSVTQPGVSAFRLLPAGLVPDPFDDGTTGSVVTSTTIVVNTYLVLTE